MFDKKDKQLKILTNKDYTSLVDVSAEVTVWYTTEGGAYHLEDIEYPQGGTSVHVEPVREDIKCIIILPRPEDVKNTEGLISSISKYLADNTGWFVAPPDLAVEIANRLQGSSSPLNAIDSNTGNVDMQRYLEPQRLLMTAIAKETRSDAVFEVRIIKVKADVRGFKASWDDMTEPVASGASRVLFPFGGKGWVYAATADMNLWSQSGKLLWKERRGFAVLGFQSGMSSKYYERPLTDVYKNTAFMKRWLDSALGPLAPAVKGTSAGTPQISPELQEQLEKAKQAGDQQK